MITKKICLVGAFAVGKTSLVRQFVESIYSEKYHTTIGVKIDKKTISSGEKPVQLMIWDIEGIDVFTDLKLSYLRGASGVIIVADGTRPETMKAAKEVKKIVTEALSDPALLLLVNKRDLDKEWCLVDKEIDALNIQRKNIFETSAKTGNNVEQAFLRIVELMT